MGILDSLIDRIIHKWLHPTHNVHKVMIYNCPRCDKRFVDENGKMRELTKEEVDKYEFKE